MQQTPPKSRQHIYGFVLLLISCVLSINPFFLLFTLPACLAGIGLIVGSAVDPPSKVGLCLVPFILPLAFYLIILL